MRLHRLAPAALVTLFGPLALAHRRCAALRSGGLRARAARGPATTRAWRRPRVIPRPDQVLGHLRRPARGRRGAVLPLRRGTRGDAVALATAPQPRRIGEVRVHSQPRRHGARRSRRRDSAGLPGEARRRRRPGIIAGRPASADLSYEPFNRARCAMVNSTNTFVAPRRYVPPRRLRQRPRRPLRPRSRYARGVHAASEWVTVPLFVASVYSWEGQSLWLVYLPAVIVFVAGLIAARPADPPRTGSILDLPGWTAAVAALLFVASGVAVAVQMAVALSMSGLDPLWRSPRWSSRRCPVALGALTLWLAFRNSGAGWTARIAPRAGPARRSRAVRLGRLDRRTDGRGAGGPAAVGEERRTRGEPSEAALR